MYAIGLPTVIAAARAASWPAVVLAAVVVLVIIRSLYTAVLAADEDVSGQAPLHPGQSLQVVWAFYRRRFDFLRGGFNVTGAPIFRFGLLGRSVIAVSGEAGRKAVLTAPSFDLNEGFKILSGAIPIVAGITSELPAKTIKLIHKRLGAVQSHDRLSQLIPRLLEDCRHMMEAWPTTGSFDPFSRLHEVVFQLTVRSLSGSELADDPVAVARLHKLYETLDNGNTPAAVLLPWLPSFSAVRNTWTSKTIYDTLLAFVRQRQATVSAGFTPEHDTLQMLLDENTQPELIVGFMMGLIVAGSRSTGTTASWVLTFLGCHPEWHSALKAELESFLLNHASLGKEASLSAQLASVPLDAWEQSMPVLDSVIRETLRLAQPHVAMRRNMGAEFTLPGGVDVPSGSFVVYPFSDVHLDPSLYPDPWRFDPSRPEPKGVELGYVGWGGGKTICAGQRLARLKIKLLVATFTLGFDCSITDRDGRSSQPTPNWNDTLTCKPTEGCIMHYERKTTL